MIEYSKIAQAIRTIAGVTAGGASIFPAEVKQTDGMTCSVLIGELELTDVRLRAVVNNEQDQLLLTPKQGSKVLVADLSGGDLRDLCVIQFSEIETIDLTVGKTKLHIEDDKIEMNDGNLGGLIKIQDLTDKLNDLTQTVNSLINSYNAHTHIVSTTGTAVKQEGTAAPTTSTATTAQTFNKSDYEDTKITH